ncbi:hypothetical protein FB388_2712 [Pseudonocardia cypriaca]|uniref:Uncharacterized protein n=1 Tax=Pseudonocardia cypriaca TaxID=882449 RepID=A0A543GGV6_9PSEU|nr:hypothetical protein FB388_2712 [Pseudonocardia cypriaca]
MALLRELGIAEPGTVYVVKRDGRLLHPAVAEVVAAANGVARRLSAG